MYLKEVVINGFKSFADRTRMELDSGVVAIVGPNGCGKSNIADAIRWVLGEQSAKALRGGKMQDVIFEGSEGRKPVNLCEVLLRFTDCEKQLGTAFHEVEIGRRVTREGSSDYFINGKHCRLKDIQRLFMDTGVGRVSYSFLVQGQIDQILSSNPADRRIIFEEAAGITKYKSQRREAMNKLALVETNLARVTDVIEEVSRQIGSLKRQAGKALRFKRLKHRLTHLEQAELAYRHGELQAEISALEVEASGLREKLAIYQAQSAEQEKRLEAERQERGGIYERMQEAQQQVYALRSEKEQAENRAEFAGVREVDLKQRMDEVRQEVADLAEQQEALTRQAADDSEVKQLQLNLVGTSDEAFQEKNREMFEAQERLSRAENELQDRKQHLLMLESSISRLRSNQTSLEVDLKTYQVKHGGLKDALKEAETRGEELAAGAEELSGARVGLSRRYQAEEERVATLREELRKLQADFRARQEQIQEQDRGLARRTAHLQVLENLNAGYEGFGEGARAIMKNQLGDVLPEDRRRLLSAAMQVEEEFAAGLEALLESAGDAIAVESFEVAAKVVCTLTEKQLGRACLKIPAPVGASPQSERRASDLPSGLRSALEVIGVAESATEHAELRALLDGSYFCEDLPAFVKWWQAHPDFCFHRVANRDGEVIDARGLLLGGVGKGTPDSFLKRQGEIRTLKRDLKKQEKQLEMLRHGARAVQEKMDGLESELEQARERAQESARELSNLAVQEQAATQAREENSRQRANMAKQLAELEVAHVESERRLAGAREALKKAESEISGQRQQIEKAEATVRAAREERDAKREGLADVRLQLAEKKQRLDAIDRNLHALKDKSRELHDLRLRREQEIDTLGEQISERVEDARRERAKAAEVEKTLAVLMQSLDRDRKAFQEVEERVRALEKDQARYREQEREQETGLNRREVRLAELRSSRDFLLQRLSAEYQTPIGDIDWKQELWLADEEFESRVNLDALEEGDTIEARPRRERGEPGPEDLQAMDETDWAEVGREVKALKERMQSMGPVNLVAIEEYADLSQRYQFLKEQSDDLWNSKEKLLAAIDEINSISQTLFRDTFEQVTRNFQFTYDQLTGGGYSDLKLVDAEDLLDSGIEIIARPPGTKLKSISLLSGGQKTMTAVALLFAIYMVKPSPFCVLDELDAPLDDANIGRFTQMLKRFTEFSQFLIITHNKRTIASADMIYGVTMPEKGVSRLLSMRFNHDRGVAETAPEEMETADNWKI